MNIIPRLRLKLFPKFVLLLALLSVIPAVIVGVRTININREGMQASILELHTHLVSSLADDIHDYLGTLDREIQYVIKTMGARMAWNDRQAVLQALLDTNENLVAVSIVDKKGRELLKAYNPALEKDPRLLSRADDAAFSGFWKEPSRSSLSGVYFVDEAPRINIVYPLGADHCLYSTISLSVLWNKVTQTRIASTGYAFLVNERGAIIMHPRRELAIINTDASGLPVVQQALKAVAVGSSEYVHPDTKREIVGAYAPVKGLKWGVIVQQDKEEAYVSVSRMKKQATALILVSMLATILVALIIARGLTRPLVTLTRAARRVADKNFDTRVRVNTGDELQDLAETFNEMTTELERYDRLQVDKIVEEKTKTEAVIFSIADGILMTDTQGRLQLANAPAKEIFELPENGWLNQPIWDIVKNERLRTVFDDITRDPAHNATRELDLSVGGLYRYFKFSSQDVKTRERRENIGIVTVIRNITLEKELEKMKDDFLHSITHDLRNPMTSIRGFLKFLLDGVAGPVNDQQKKMLDTMDRASNRLMGLINDILDIAKLESGRMILNLSAADLRSVAKRTIEIAEGQAIKKSIRLVIEAPETLRTINADTGLLERVFTNLIGNSLKFTPENGTITVRFEERPGQVMVSVIDTGEGIPQEYINKVFDKFQQVAGQRKGGTGLGLTICKHIVEAHMGSIWAESTVGQGSSFIFTLPDNLTADSLLVHMLKNSNETKPS